MNIILAQPSIGMCSTKWILQMPTHFLGKHPTPLQKAEDNGDLGGACPHQTFPSM